MLMSMIHTAIDTLFSGAVRSVDNTSRTKLLEDLKRNLSMFEKQLLAHLNHEEQFFAGPVARKVSHFRSTRGLMRKRHEW